MSDSESLVLAKLLEEQHRRLAKDDLAEYSKWMFPEEPPAKHHKLLIEGLQEIESGKIRFLIVEMPPGSAKSSYGSIRFPSWYLGRHPKHDIIAGSHTATLAERFGRRVRNILQDPHYQRVFPVSVSSDNSSVGQWSTNEGGEYNAVGVKGAIHGRRANGIIIDDPVPGREEADSETFRNACWEWWKADIWPRLKPNGWVIIIMTRWTVDDLAGRLWEQWKDTGQVKRIRIPMESEGLGDLLDRPEGQRLWPEWFTDEMVSTAKMDARNWSALYQQCPVPDSGDYFKREWVQIIDTLPPLDELTLYGASDYAVTHGGGDSTEHGIGAVTKDDDLIICDWWHGHTSTDIWIEELMNLAQKYKKLGHPIMEWIEEKGQIEKSVGPFIEKRMQETKTFFYRNQYASTADKPSRAQSIRGRFAQGKVYFLRAPWNTPLINEMMEFPVEGRPDNRIDVLSLFGRRLADMRKPYQKKAKSKPIYPLQLTYNDFLKYSDSYRPKRSRI